MNTQREFDLMHIAPPNSPDAERAVIGAMLSDKSVVDDATVKLRNSSFYLSEHREIFRAITTLHLNKKPVDVLTVSEELKRSGTLDGVGGQAYLIECYRYVPTTANSATYIEAVSEKWRLRTIIAQCRKAEQKCYAQMSDSDEIAETLRADIRDLNIGDDGFVEASEVATTTFDFIERKAKGEEQAIMTGIKDFDNMTGGLLGGDFLVIGARPAVGKSVVGMEIAENVAASGKHVVVCSREMQDIQYGIRAASRGSSIPGTQLKTGMIGDNQWEQLGDAMDAFAQKSIGFLFNTRNVEDLSAKVKRRYDKEGVDLVVVDYLQLMGTAQSVKERYLQVGIVSRGLKELATELKIPVVALAQVKRSDVKRCPVMDELRESGDIEQDADIIVLLHDPDDDSDASIPSCDKEIFNSIINMGRKYLLFNVDKQRMGATGKFGMDFDPPMMRLRSLDRRTV